MSSTIICFTGRCSTWGKSWNRHIWTIREYLHDQCEFCENYDDCKDCRFCSPHYPKKYISKKSDDCWRCGMSKKEAALD